MGLKSITVEGQLVLGIKVIEVAGIQILQQLTIHKKTLNGLHHLWSHNIPSSFIELTPITIHTIYHYQ